MTKENQSFVIWQNQTAQVTVNVDQTGSTTAQTLTGALAMNFYMTSDKAGASSDAVLTLFSSDGLVALTNVDGTNDGVQFTIESSDSAGISPKSYFYEVWVKDSSSDAVPVTTGKINVRAATGSG